VTDSAAGRAKDAKLRRALSALSPREREALHRFYNLGYDITRIFQELGIKDGDFQKLRSRLRGTFFGTDESQ
jgi:DNA-directed RNA polymerase specialized sigma24 family protein